MFRFTGSYQRKPKDYAEKQHCSQEKARLPTTGSARDIAAASPLQSANRYADRFGPASALSRPMTAPRSFWSRYSRGEAFGSILDSVRIVEGKGEDDCVVTAMASVTGGDYDYARQYAARHGFSATSGGMKFGPARDALREMGVNATYRRKQPKSWSGFPKKAIVSVIEPGIGHHAVVLKDEYIYDCNKSVPVHRSNYDISSKSSYIVL